MIVQHFAVRSRPLFRIAGLFALIAVSHQPAVGVPRPAGDGPPPVTGIRSAVVTLTQNGRSIGRLLLQAKQNAGTAGFTFVGQFLGLRPGAYAAQALGFTSLNGAGQAVARASGTAAVTARRTVTLRLQWEFIGRKLVSIEVTPADSSVLVNHSIQFTATGFFSDGSQQDITNRVTWSSSNTEAAIISNGGVDEPPKGEARGVGSGGDETTITATDPLTSIEGSTLLFTTD